MKIELKCSEKYVIDGESVAGNHTGFWIEKLKFVLDAGMIINKQPKGIFITHAHNDHSQMLPFILSCRSKLTPVFMPTDAYEPIKLLLSATKALADSKVVDYGDKIFDMQKCDVKTVKYQDKIIMNDIQIEILKCYHSCESVGYGFSTTRKKLKKEFVNLPKEEIMKIKNFSENYYDEIVPQFIFYGDTNIDALLKHTEWQSYPSIIIECTSYATILEENKTKYYDRGHINLLNIEEIIAKHQDKQFVLIHSSQQFDLELIEKELQRINKNVVICKKL